MEPKCSVPTCELKAELECICKHRMSYFCGDHFLEHRRKNPNLRHISQDIQHENEETNEVCIMCNIKPPSLLCLCNNKVNPLCQECIGIHSQIGISHCIEPLDAAVFIKDSQDISYYMNRKTKVQKFILKIEENLKIVKSTKHKFKRLIEDAFELLQQTMNNGLLELEKLENGLNELKSKAGQAQFVAKLDVTDFVFGLISEDFSKFTNSLESLEFFQIKLNPDILPSTLANLITISNFITFFTDKKNQILTYFNENKDRMSKSIQQLYNLVLDGGSLDCEKIVLLEHYQHYSEDLSKVLPHFPNIKSIELSGNNIGSTNIKLLIPSLKGFTKLIDLNIGGNNIVDEGCAYLCEFLPDLFCLENLFLYKNGLTDLSAKLLAQAMPSLPNLKMISLNQNTIGDDGVGYLAGIIKSLKNLEAIGLQCNQITARSCQNIIKLIQELPNLSDFSLDDNKLGNETAAALIKLLPTIQKEMKLYVRNNQITEALEDQLKLSGGNKVRVAISYKIY